MVSNIKKNDILAGLITVALFNDMYIHANPSSVSERAPLPSISSNDEKREG